MKRLKNIIVLLFRINILKTIRFNTTYFPLSVALKCPVLIANNVKIDKLRGGVKIEAPIRTGMIKIGFGEVGIYDRKYSRSILELSGIVHFKGKAAIGHGSRISVGASGILEIGNMFNSTAEMSIVCYDKIILGDEMLVSWQTLIMDTDFHPTINRRTGIKNVVAKPIIIGQRVWIGTKAMILKGTVIPDNCIVGANTLCNKKYDIPEYSVLAGNLAVLKATDVERLN